MNESIEDERGVIEVGDFDKMWFTFFKGEKHAKIVFDKLLPTLVVKTDGRDMVSVIKLGRFIDIYNYFPVKANDFLSKNASNEMTYVMTSNTRSSLAKL